MVWFDHFDAGDTVAAVEMVSVNQNGFDGAKIDFTKSYGATNQQGGSTPLRTVFMEDFQDAMDSAIDLAV
jgi:hypothetical protein